MSKEKKIIFIGSQTDIFALILKKHGRNIMPRYKYQSRIAYKLRYLFNIFHLKTSFLSDLHDDVLKSQADVIVVTGSLIYEPFIKRLKDAFPKASIKYCYPNVVDDFASLNPDVLKKYGIYVYSWDIEDCRKYNLRQLKSCYDGEILKLKSESEYDLCFIGADKGRYQRIKEIEDYAERNQLHTYIHVTSDYSFLSFIHSYYKKPIKYKKYLEIVSKSKCIIDFVRRGQSGTTMRTMEAIFSGQKLISNNPFLKQMDFYHPNNIYVLEDDNSNIDGIKDFLEKEPVPVNQEILNTYTFDYYYKTLLKDDD